MRKNKRSTHPLIIRKSFSDMNGASSRPPRVAFMSEQVVIFE